MEPRKFKPEFLKEPALFMKTSASADIPTRERPLDATFRLTLISRSKERDEDYTGDINEFDTGLCCQPPHGYHFEVVAEPSLYSSGYMTMTKVLDPQDQSPLTIQLYKFRDGEDLDLPIHGARLVLRKTEYPHLASATVTAVENPEMGYLPPPKRGQHSAYSSMPSGRSRSRGRQEERNSSHFI